MLRYPTLFVPSTVVLDKTPDAGVPKAGVTSVGLVANTSEPLPVSLVTAAARFAEDGVPKKVAIPAPNEVIPVPPLATGRVPVTLVVRLANVVEVVPVPPFAIGRVPVTCVVRLTPESAPPNVKLPVVVTVPVKVMPLTVPVPPTDVTEPEPPPAPIAARNDAASRDETVLSALNCGNVTADGFGTVKRLEPSVVAPRPVRAFGASVAPVPPRATDKVPVVPATIGNPVAFVRVPDEGVPKTGVTKVGDVANTKAPLPVSSVTAAARLAEEGVAKKVATLDPRPDTPVLIGNPVAFVNVPDCGVPSIGVTRLGLVANTKEPDPVSSVTAAARLAEDGVPRNVATPAPRDVMPVPPLATGNVPVTLVARLVKVVELVPVPPFAIGKMPDTSVVNTAGLLATLTKSDPFQATSAFVPEGTVTPVVGPAPRKTTEPVPALITT